MTEHSPDSPDPRIGNTTVSKTVTRGSAPSPDAHLLLRAFCDELARCGVTDACTSPGSRSTPLVLSLVREPRLRTWSHIDERVAGFFALGLAKRTRRPVAIAVTSGTAAAELLPAVVEAHESGVPLIVLTADRPPELRDVGAGQAIDQLKLYGGAAKWFVELGSHAATPERIRWIRTLACRAAWTAADGRPGVVHVNVPLREPLVLDGPLPADPQPGRADGRPWVALATPPPDPDQVPPLDLAPGRRGVIVAGRTEGDSLHAQAICDLAEDTGYPLLADPLSGARAGGAAIAHYDALLRDEPFAAQQPDLVLRFGELPTSKPLRSWLAGLGPEVQQIAIDAQATWQDPDGVVGVRSTLGVFPAAIGLAETHGGTADPAWLERWRAADAAAARAIAATIGAGAGDPLNEPRVAAEVVEATADAGALLYVAASMPVRDVETFAAAFEHATPPTLSNRGANGIDGTVASALGAAAADRGPIVLLIGDVALAYDLGALLSARRLGLDLAIVLVNNDGGGIFHFLPVAGQRDAFEEHVATPHGLDFAAAAALYGARHAPVATSAELHAELARATVAGAGVTIVEVRTDRDENVALHRRVWAAVTAALAGG